MKSIFILLVIVFISTESVAGNKVGNGGDVVVCEGKKDLLDLHEAMEERIELGDFTKNTSYLEIAKSRLEILSKINLALGGQYLRRLETIQKDIDFKSGIELTDVQDSLHIDLPKKCKLVQVAIRKGYSIGSEKKFVIENDLFQELSKQNQAALIVHEIVYEHLNKLGVDNSRSVRKIVGRLFSKNFETEKSSSFWSFIKKLEVPLYP